MILNVTYKYNSKSRYTYKLERLYDFKEDRKECDWVFYMFHIKIDRVANVVRVGNS